jgi:hypothetical protein
MWPGGQKYIPLDREIERQRENRQTHIYIEGDRQIKI